MFARRLLRDGSSNSDPFFANVVLFLKGSDGSSTILDSSPNPKTITLFGSPIISTSQAKYGISSIYLNGSSYLSANMSAAPFDTSLKWTIEAWQYITAGDDWTISADSLSFYFTKNVVGVYVGDGSVNTINAGAWIQAFNTWEHVALSFDGTTYRVFRNGVLVLSNSTPLSNQMLNKIDIGSRGGADIFTTGFYNNVRVTKDCRYVTSFSPNTDTFMD